MRKSRFTVEQIVYALKQVETGVPVGEQCRKLGISEQTFYAWKKKYAAMGVSEAKLRTFSRVISRRFVTRPIEASIGG